MRQFLIMLNTECRRISIVLTGCMPAATRRRWLVAASHSWHRRNRKFRHWQRLAGATPASSRVGFKTVGDILAKTAIELARLPLIGPSNVTEIKAKLSAKGLALREEAQ